MFQRKIEPAHEGYFDDIENARRYAASAEQSMMRYKAFLKRLQQVGMKGKYLEIGAGPGILATVIANENPDIEITAVDLSSSMITVGQEYVKSKSTEKQITFVQGGAHDGDLLKTLGKFDLIYSTYALHHWDDPEKVIRNLLAILTDIGVIILYDLRRVGWLYWVPVKNGFFSSIRAAYKALEIKTMLQHLNIEHVEHVEIRKEFPFMLSIVIRK